jgi:hypothetical protein
MFSPPGVKNIATPHKRRSKMNSPTTDHRIPDLSLTCRTQDLPYFVTLGLTALRTREAVIDLELARADRDLYPERCRIAAAGIPFYGYATTSIDRVPAVFAADGVRHCEAPAGSGQHPTAYLSASFPFPDVAELTRGRLYYRCLANALAALPDPEPWLPTMAKVLADVMDCKCGGRGWFLAEDKRTRRFVVCRCNGCCMHADDLSAGRIAYDVIEAGWPE